MPSSVRKDGKSSEDPPRGGQSGKTGCWSRGHPRGGGLHHPSTPRTGLAGPSRRPSARSRRSSCSTVKPAGRGRLRGWWSIIKSFPRAFATTPIIAVTAYAMEGDRQRTLVAGLRRLQSRSRSTWTRFPPPGRRVPARQRPRARGGGASRGVYLRRAEPAPRLPAGETRWRSSRRLNQHFRAPPPPSWPNLHRARPGPSPPELGVQAMLETACCPAWPRAPRQPRS